MGNQYINEGIDHFRKYGYKTIIIWEHELKDEKALMLRVSSFILEK